MKNKILLISLGTFVFGLLGFSIHHTWYQNSPERFTDPVNWCVFVVFVVLYFVLMKICKGIK